MTDYSLDFIGRTLLEFRAEMREFRARTEARLGAVERELAQLRDEHMVNTAWLMRDRAEPIAAAHLQSQIQRMNSRLQEMERRVERVEGRLPAAE